MGGGVCRTRPLLGLWHPNTAPLPCKAAAEDTFTLQGDAGSIAATATRVLITSPKGGAAMIFGSDGIPIATHRRADLCGAAAIGDGFLLTNGLGAIWAADDSGSKSLGTGPTAWDNRLIALA